MGRPAGSFNKCRVCEKARAEITATIRKKHADKEALEAELARTNSDIMAHERLLDLLAHVPEPLAPAVPKVRRTRRKRAARQTEQTILPNGEGEEEQAAVA